RPPAIGRTYLQVAVAGADSGAGGQPDQPESVRDGEGLDPVVGTELAVEAGLGVLHRLGGDAECPGGLAGGVAVGDVVEDLPLARGQRRDVAGGVRSGG